MKSIIFAESSQLEKVGYNVFTKSNNTVIVVMPGMKFEIEKYVENSTVVTVPDFSTMVGARTLR